MSGRKKVSKAKVDVVDVVDKSVVDKPKVSRQARPVNYTPLLGLIHDAIRKQTEQIVEQNRLIGLYLKHVHHIMTGPVVEGDDADTQVAYNDPDLGVFIERLEIETGRRLSSEEVRKVSEILPEIV